MTSTAAPSTLEAEKPTAVEGSQIFPAGLYAAADPVFVLPGDAWRHAVFTLMGGHASITVRYRGSLILVWTTQNGEGVFPLYEGRHFRANVATDNCLLCLAPAKLLELPDGTNNSSAGFGVGIYEVGSAAPHVTADGNVTHGDFEVITSQGVGGDYDARPGGFAGGAGQQNGSGQL